MGHCRRRRFVLSFVSAFIVIVGTFGQEVCDDGHTGVEKDFGTAENYECISDEHWSTIDGQQLTTNECTNDTLLERAVCMSDDISYSTTPPLGGAYRHLPPQFGEYLYLPPERWVHALMLGGVVFLYHPCALPEQVTELRNLARGCLQRHIITPYPHLTKPFAIVVWGCVLHMAQVEAGTAKAWIQDQGPSALPAPSNTQDQYSFKLQHSAEVVGNVLCPDVNTFATTSNHTEILHPQTSETHDPTEEGGKGDDSSEVPVGKPLGGQSEEEEKPSPHPDQSSNVTAVVYVTHVNEDPEEVTYSRKGIIFGVFVVFCVLFVAGLVVAIVLQRKFKWIKSSYKPRKYKFLGSFFPSGDAHTYIPPTGTPKVPGAEQLRLLDSDEEEV